MLLSYFQTIFIINCIYNKAYYTVLFLLKSAFYLINSIIFTKFVQCLKLNKITVFNRIGKFSIFLF